MHIDPSRFFSSEDARRFAIDLMQWGDDGPCVEDLIDQIEAALTESNHLKTKEDRKEDA